MLCYKSVVSGRGVQHSILVNFELWIDASDSTLPTLCTVQWHMLCASSEYAVGRFLSKWLLLSKKKHDGPVPMGTASIC